MCFLNTKAQEKLWIEKDSTSKVKRDSIKLKYPFKSNQKASLFLQDPSVSEIIYDTKTKRYVILEKIGDNIIKRPVVLTEEEYQEYRLKKDMLSYYKEKIGAIGGKKKGAKEAQKNLLPTYYVNSDFFESVFGGKTIEVNPSGSVLVKMGALYQKVDNPQLSEENRSSFTFDFDQEISASIQAKIGKRVSVNAQYDTQSTFNFQNQVKLEYTPDEDDILRKIEVGNVSMPIKNSLIVGAQSLFGVKAELQFGKTTVTGVFAEQKSQTRTVAAQGGGTIEEFELQASDYDENRHFFLAHYFRDNYNKALKNYPLVDSPVNITKVEVWVTNKNATTENIRNIVAFADLAEGNATNIGPSNVLVSAGEIYPNNNSNNLSNTLTLTNPIRKIATVTSGIAPYGMQQGRDYSVLENAIKLKPNEYTVHPQLGYISLNRRLTESEVLAVAFEYTVSGDSKVYKVGEFSTDGVIAPDNIVVKLLRSELTSTKIPMWNLMMKNIYALQTYQLSNNGFRLELLYADDKTGVPINTFQNAVTAGISEKTLLNLTNVDVLDQSLTYTPEGDGFFDYVEGITVNSRVGLIIFPVVEPFGDNLKNKLIAPQDKTYIFNELYEITQSEAKNNYQNKDKYLIKGYFKSEESGGIPLGAFNVPKGSVRVTSGGRMLVEGVDYVVDYQRGKVQIVNPSLEASNAPIEVSVENNATFSLQTKRFIGLDVEHKISDNFIVGASFLNLNEKPVTQKAQFGYEPINNTIFGLNAMYGTKVPFFTKLVNKLPNIDTDVESNLSVRGDFAYLKPGSPKRINVDGEATSYIDDFEGSQIPLEIRSIQQWHMASTPQNQTKIDLGGNEEGLPYGYKRARLAWYIIDPLFYGGGSTKPSNIGNEELSRAEVRRVRYEELFPEQDLDVTQIDVVRTFDLAYYPHERGSYNYDTSNVGADGKFTNPEDRWAGITRALNTTNFQQANVEYIEFWLMDPYENYSITSKEGLPFGIDPKNPANQVGELYFNLGEVSEDILKDGRKSYENGLPKKTLETGKTDETVWGKVPNMQSLLYAFGDGDEERKNQDVGYDGLNDEEEIAKFGTAFGADPSNDNYKYFRSSKYDAANASILTRYKKFNNTQGNSPTASLSPESYPTAATNYPDVEDINKDQTMNTVESYYQYKVSLNAEDLKVGQNHIVDEKNVEVTLANGQKRNTRWLQFRVQVANPDEVINDFSGFSSIRFMRMFLTKFKMPVVLRFGEFQLVRGDWRRYTKTIDKTAIPQDLTSQELQNFEVGVVNIQENENRSPIPYRLPPGIKREILRGTSTLQRQNEQSVTIKVKSLPPKETRAIYKNLKVDLRMYKKLKLFIHAEGIQGLSQVKDGDLKAIIRLGSDLNDNYYQLEKPLKISDYSAVTPLEIWPSENNLDVILEHLGKLKMLRIEAGVPANQLFPQAGIASPIPNLNGYEIRVKGNPNLANIKTVMLGVKNISATENANAEIWFNEMRAAGFDNDGGWAAVVTADANFADFANVSVTGRMETRGFGGIEQTVNERSQFDTKQYDIVSNVNVGQLLPKSWNINLPISVSLSEQIKDPKYDPQYQDILFEDAKRKDDKARDYTKRRSISFMNVKKNYNPENTEKKQRFYDVENLSISLAYNDTYHRDYNIKRHIEQGMRASANYSYSFEPKIYEPFKNWKAANSKYLKFIKDFNINLLPNSISVNSNITRNYNEQLSRTLIEGLPQLPTLRQHHYLFDWNYELGYNLTKSLQFNFRATNNYIYDNFDKNEDIKLFSNLFNIGRPDHYNQQLSGTYKIPLDKFPFLDFIRADYAYTADFDWQASSPSYANKVGNVIQNSSAHAIKTTLDLKKLYTTVGLTKLLTSKKAKKDSKTKKSTKKNNKNTVGSVFYNILTSIKTARFNYNESNGTHLPGYLPEMGFLGRDSYNGGFAPTLGFVFGSQVDILQKAVEKGWLISRNSTSDPYYNQTYTNTHNNKFDVAINVEPLKSLKIEFRGNKTFNKRTSKQIDVVSGVLNQNSPVSEFGDFVMSYNMLGSTFTNNDANFEQFKANREIIAKRWAGKTGKNISGFGKTSQQVALPAFLAAYTGKSASKISLKAFRNIPIPGWRVDYRGLMSMKWFKRNFRSFSLSHSYKSLYTITNYTNNSAYNPKAPYSNLDIVGNYQSSKIFTNVNLIEEFSPLIKMDVKFKNSLSLVGRLNKDRALMLNFNNNTITQNNGTEYTLGLGYRIKDLAMNFRLRGKKTRIKGDLNLKADITLRDDKTVIRAIDQDNNQVTGGQRLLSIKFFADYAVSKNLTASFYFDQSASSYAISTTFPRQSISSGLSVRYVLGN